MAASSSFEINDTLQITKEQGFPSTLDITKYMEGNVDYSDIIGQTFTFHDKPNLRNFVVPPVRCFLVENINGKWVYRGLCHILELKLDYINMSTSGTYKIIKIFAPSEIPLLFDLIDGVQNTKYFT